MDSGIYQITNTVNSKKYIGSSVKLKKRKRSHFNMLDGNRHSNNHLQNSYTKHGKSCFSYHVLANCPPEYCIKLEQWFLDTQINWDKDYNILKVADHREKGNIIYKYDAKGNFIEEYKSGAEAAKMNNCSVGNLWCCCAQTKQAKTVKNHLYSFDKITKAEAIKRLERRYHNIIYKYDHNGNFLKRYTSIKEASKDSKVDRSTIRQILQGKRKNPRTFIWSYNKLKKNEITKSNNGGKIYQFTKKGIFVKEWESIAIANKFYQYKGIGDCVRGKIRIYKGFIWVKNKEEITKRINDLQINKKAKPISQYSKGGVFIKSYISSIEAEKETGIMRGNIRAAASLSSNVKSAGGFKWEYNEQ